MPEFGYRASDASGQIREGALQAANEIQMVGLLRERGLTAIDIWPASSRGGFVPGASPMSPRSRARNGGFGSSRSVGQQDVLNLTSELAIMLRAGLSLDAALRVLLDMSTKPAVAALVGGVLEDVKGGSPLSKALTAHQAVFGDFYINMVRSGELSGQLAQVFSRLVEHLERVRSLRDSVVSATIYPAILLGVAVLSLIAMLGFVVPQFETLFRDMGEALPMPTRFVLDLGALFTEHGLLILAGGVGVALLFRKWAGSEQGRAALQSFMLRLPVLGRILFKYDITRFSRSLGTLLGNGVPILTALGIATETVGTAPLRQALSGVVPSMKGGGRLTDALSKTGIFEPLALNLVRVGEETGRLDAMMLELSRIFDRDVENAIKRGLTMLEPLLILTLGVLIAAIIVSILMGILSINDLAL